VEAQEFGPEVPNSVFIMSLISGSEESHVSPWSDLVIEIHKASPLDTPKPILLRSKDLSDCM
jgi:hypothetical protein